jgi:hypothetical protein
VLVLDDAKAQMSNLHHVNKGKSKMFMSARWYILLFAVKGVRVRMQQGEKRPMATMGPK